MYLYCYIRTDTLLTDVFLPSPLLFLIFARLIVPFDSSRIVSGASELSFPAPCMESPKYLPQYPSR